MCLSIKGGRSQHVVAPKWKDGCGRNVLAFMPPVIIEFGPLSDKPPNLQNPDTATHPAPLKDLSFDLYCFGSPHQLTFLFIPNHYLTKSNGYSSQVVPSSTPMTALGSPNPKASGDQPEVGGRKLGPHQCTPSIREADLVKGRGDGGGGRVRIETGKAYLQVVPPTGSLPVW